MPSPTAPQTFTITTETSTMRGPSQRTGSSPSAAATARETLLDQAASRLGLAKDMLAVRDGLIAPRSGGNGVSYAQLIGGRKFTVKVDDSAPKAK